MVNGTVATCLPQLMAIEPPASVMSTNSQVSSSRDQGRVAIFMGARTTSLSGVYSNAPHSASLLLGSYFCAAGQLETTKVHLPGFRSMNRLYSPGGTVVPLITMGTSVLRRGETLA